MIPYSLIVASANRPHLLEKTIFSHLAHVDQAPSHIFIHNDEAFKDREGTPLHSTREAKCRTIAYFATAGSDILGKIHHQAPPAGHGAALGWLLDEAAAQGLKYVLYTQDDFLALRALPIQQALKVMDTQDFHQIRFNKRPTLQAKKNFVKHELRFRIRQHHDDGCDLYSQCYRGCICGAEPVLTVSDQWYFQTGLWRVEPIRQAVKGWLDANPQAFREDPEAKINAAFDGKLTNLKVNAPPPGAPNDLATRLQYQRTFIWGPIGEPAFVKHIGDQPEDWASRHIRDGRLTGPGA